jgi:hypothetical protein
MRPINRAIVDGEEVDIHRCDLARPRRLPRRSHAKPIHRRRSANSLNVTLRIRIEHRGESSRCTVKTNENALQWRIFAPLSQESRLFLYGTREDRRSPANGRNIRDNAAFHPSLGHRP